MKERLVKRNRVPDEETGTRWNLVVKKRKFERPGIFAERSSVDSPTHVVYTMEGARLPPPTMLTSFTKNNTSFSEPSEIPTITILRY